MTTKFFPVACALAASVFLALTSACSRPEEAPAPVAIEEVPDSMNSAFTSADAEVRQVVDETVAAIQGQDDVRAFMQLQQLTDRTDLTPEQRAAASAGQVAVNLRLQEAAARGNREAAQVLEVHRSRK